MAVTYDPQTQSFSDVVTLGDSSSDHHKGPVIWADKDDHLHVLFGCHRTPGTHLFSRQPGTIGRDLDAWNEAPEIAPGISYQTFHRIYDAKQLVYYRTEGHRSSWTSRVTEDNGMTWTGPTGASSTQCCCYRNGTEELYDHRSDPNEHRNLAGDPGRSGFLGPCGM